MSVITEEQRYEKMLMIQYDSTRKDLDIMLSSMIPTQKSLIKTLMWFNSLLLAFIGAILSQYHYEWYCYFINIASIVAIFLILKSLIDGRKKYFGHPSLETITDINIECKWSVSSAILANIISIDMAIKENSKIIEKRASSIHISTLLTIVSMGIIIIFLGFHLLKGDTMSNGEKPTKVEVKPEVAIDTNNTQKPDTQSETYMDSINESTVKKSNESTTQTKEKDKK